MYICTYMYAVYESACSVHNRIRTCGTKCIISRTLHILHEWYRTYEYNDNTPLGWVSKPILSNKREGRTPQTWRRFYYRKEPVGIFPRTRPSALLGLPLPCCWQKWPRPKLNRVHHFSPPKVSEGNLASRCHISRVVLFIYNDTLQYYYSACCLTHPRCSACSVVTIHMPSYAQKGTQNWSDGHGRCFVPARPDYARIGRKCRSMSLLVVSYVGPPWWKSLVSPRTGNS